MKILICCALKQEALPLAKVFNLKPVHTHAHIFKGIYGGHEFKLILTGPGKDNVRAAFPEIFELPLPDAVISYGFAGALSSSLQKGDVLIANRVMRMDDGKTHVFQIPLKNDPTLFQKVPFSIHAGTLLSMSNLVSTTEEKKSLGRRFDALAVDMESGYLCDEVLKRKLIFFAMRGITDTWNENIPAVTQYWTGPNGKMLKQRMIQDIFKTPRMIPSLIRLGFTIQRASRHLIQFFISALNQGMIQ